MACFGYFLHRSPTVSEVVAPAEQIILHIMAQAGQPAVPADKYELGTSMRGVDGSMWRVGSMLVGAKAAPTSGKRKLGRLQSIWERTSTDDGHARRARTSITVPDVSNATHVQATFQEVSLVLDRKTYTGYKQVFLNRLIAPDPAKPYECWHLSKRVGWFPTAEDAALSYANLVANTHKRLAQADQTEAREMTDEDKEDDSCVLERGTLADRLAAIETRLFGSSVPGAPWPRITKLERQILGQPLDGDLALGAKIVELERYCDEQGF